MAANTERFIAAAKTVYGEKWPHRLAADRRLLVRSVRRWASGAREAPEDLVEDLEWQAGHIQSTGFLVELGRLIKLHERQVSPNTMAAHLADAADELRTAEPPKDRLRKVSGSKPSE